MLFNKDVILQVTHDGVALISKTVTGFTPADILYAKGGGGGQPSTTTVQKSDPWSGQQGYLTKGFQRAQSDILDQPRTFYEGSTVVPYSEETEAALDLTSQRALLGSPLINQAQNQLTSTMSGDYLYGGDAFNQAVDAATRRALPAVDSQFALGGRYGSGLAQEAQARAVGDIFANQYQQERTNQLRGMLFAPQMAEQDYADFGKLAAVGAQREALTQEQIGEDIARHDFDQMEEQNRLADYMNLIQGTYGGTQSSTSMGPATSRNTGAGILGGAATGASIGSVVPGIGTMFGAAAGGLLGAFM